MPVRPSHTSCHKVSHGARCHYLASLHACLPACQAGWCPSNPVSLSLSFSPASFLPGLSVLLPAAAAAAATATATWTDGAGTDGNSGGRSSVGAGGACLTRNGFRRARIATAQFDAAVCRWQQQQQQQQKVQITWQALAALDPLTLSFSHLPPPSSARFTHLSISILFAICYCRNEQKDYILKPLSAASSRVKTKNCQRHQPEKNKVQEK